MVKIILFLLICICFVACHKPNIQSEDISKEKSIDVETKQINAEFSKEESENFISSVKETYKAIKKYKSDGQITRILYIFPKLNNEIVNDNVMTLISRKAVKFQFAAEVPNTFDFTWKNSEPEKRGESVISNLDLNNPINVVQQNLAQSESVLPITESLDGGWVK